MHDAPNQQRQFVDQQQRFGVPTLQQTFQLFRWTPPIEILRLQLKQAHENHLEIFWKLAPERCDPAPVPRHGTGWVSLRQTRIGTLAIQ